MVYKYPIKIELHPESIDKGLHWVTLELKNVGKETITGLDIKLNSLDTYCISVLGSGKYLANLKPNEKEAIPFQVSATNTGELYASVNGLKDGKEFFWFSPNICLTAGRAAAELTSLFVMAVPYPPLRETLNIEAKIIGQEESENLSLEFWAVTPSENCEQLSTINIKKLSPGEEITYTADITPKEEGLYTIYAQLYDGIYRIGQKTDSVYVKE